MEFRFANENDTEAVKWLWSYCFEKQDDPFFHWYFSQYYRPENTLLGLKNGKLLVSLQLIPYEIFLRGQAVPVSYVIGVATYPEARQGGLVRELLHAALVSMRERGHYASILMPFKAGFYYPFQWELCYHHYKYVLPLEELRSISARGGCFSLIDTNDDWLALDTAYKKFVNGRHGYVLRSQSNWEQILAGLQAENGFCYLLSEEDSGAQGYIMYLMDQNRIVIREMAYSNKKAQQALFQFIYNHRSQVEWLEWNAPLNDLTAYSLPDPKQNIRLFPFMTARVVDAAKLLERIHYPSAISGKIVCQITDEQAPWNNIVLALTVANGCGAVATVLGEEADLCCSVGALTQLIFGRLSVVDISHTGDLSVANKGKLRLLESLFPVCNNFINEYY